MKNIMSRLPDRPGSLASLAETLGTAGVSIEGGGMFVVGGKGIANFLVKDETTAQRVLKANGVEVMRVDDVVVQKLEQDKAGQLGKLLRRMAEANVNVVTQYSDHSHQLVLVVDDISAAHAVSDAWMQERSGREPAAVERPQPQSRTHHYTVNLRWSGNRGSGTSGYKAYDRSHEISTSRKGVIEGSSDPVFRGDGTRYNPEELLVASASACHMLSFLHLCAVSGLVVLAYEDQPTGVMEEQVGGKGAFVRIDLHPTVVISGTSDAQKAEALHDRAHENCFIANSLNIPVVTHSKTVVQG